MLKDLVWNLPEAIYVMTEAGDLLDANPAFLDLIGADTLAAAQRYGGASLWQDPNQRAAALAELARTDRLCDFEFQLRRLDGQRRTVLDTCYAAADAETGERVLYGILVDITQRTELEQELRRQAVRDPLTGCYNRRFLDDLAARLDSDEVWATIVVDIDHFKRYNDEFGHHAGDEVLIRLARFLTHRIRPTDVVVRTGGDEFLIVLLGRDSAHVTQIASRFRETAGTAAPVPFTIGWAVREPGESLYDTIRRADHELIHVRVQERRYRNVRRSGQHGAPGAH